MRYGIHLPQYGSAASGEAIRRVAHLAEELGFDDVWVSDHVAQPAAQGYPSPYLYDPMLTLAWAAAATTRIGLGTSVLVAPQYHPLDLANTLASLDDLSGGRLTIAVGVGWSKGEYDALGQTFENRGRRMDEILDVLRACWRDDPVNHEGEHYTLTDMRVLPKPAHEIAIWVGGGSEPAYRRAVEKGDGFHAIGLKPDTVKPVVERIRRDRPDPGTFPFSHRTGWDPQGMDPDEIRRERDGFEAAGVQHMVAAPWRKTADDWYRSMELLAELLGLRPR